MDDEDHLRHLEEDLVAHGGAVTVRRVGNETELTITRYEGVDLDHPTVIRTTDKDFRAYLTSMAKSAGSLWPGGSPMGSAYRLFEIHLNEEMTVLAGNPDTIKLDRRGMKTVRHHPRVEEPLPPGDYEWRA